jgi:Protein of unknown function (DUF1573)
MKNQCRSIREFVFGIALLAAVLPGCFQAATEALPPPSSKVDLPIGLSSSTDLGYLLSGSGKVARLVRIRNSSDAAVRISRWTTSCECLSIEPGNIVVDAGKSTYIRLMFDPAKESDEFVGSLLMTVEGFADVECVSKFEVPVTVIAPEDAQHIDGAQI